MNFHLMLGNLCDISKFIVEGFPEMRRGGSVMGQVRGPFHRTCLLRALEWQESRVLIEDP